MEVISLDRGALLRIENARNMRRDVMLRCGQCFPLDRGGLTLISTSGAQQFSRISVWKA
jgi:hypothetical protein